MSDRRPLMPKATAAWLVENTSLTFDQIADFCQMHLLEVRGIADGDVATGIKGMDPISSGQLTREEILRGEKNAAHRLRVAESKFEMPQVKSKKGPRYTPTSRRHERPNAVVWLLRNHPELKDSQIMRLVGTTKPTIQQIRDRSHWNTANLQPQDPVTLGLCSQVDLDAEVKKSAKRVVAPLPGTPGAETEQDETLLSAAETTGYRPTGSVRADEDGDADPTVSARDEEARVLQQLRGLTGTEEESEDEEADDGDEVAELDPEAEAEAEADDAEEGEDEDVDDNDRKR